jgi:hypothetical protein
MAELVVERLEAVGVEDRDRERLPSWRRSSASRRSNKLLRFGNPVSGSVAAAVFAA